MPDDKVEIKIFSQDYIRKDFSCGNSRLDNYIKDRASKDIKYNVAATNVLTQGNTIIGYYTLSSYSIKSVIIPEPIRVKLPKYNVIPATLLGRLAVDEKYQGQGYGEFLLIHAMEKSLIASNEVASMALCVDAINDKAKKFYKQYDFVEFKDAETKLFISMEKIAEIFN